mgnify:CR=1 FL=1
MLFRSPALVYTVHNTWTSFSRPTRALNRATYGLDAADVAVSEIVRSTLPTRPRSRTQTVVHGIDLAGVREQRARRAAVRAELGLVPDELVVGTVANFRAQKDYPNLLAAARLLADRDVPVRIVAVGQGPQEAETRALHASLDLDGRVILTGRRDDAVAVMGACDAFVMASNNEGLPVAIMEALALGLPVVSTAVGGIPEAITDDVEGLLVPARDPGALADAVTRVATDEALRTRLAAGAHVGTFVETKAADIGEGAKVPHLAYVGDATIGPRANVGAGTITANYDGRAKHRTVIGADARIGSNTVLRAPVEVGEGAYTGAGSVVTHDVPPGALAKGVPAENDEGWADRLERGE